MVSIFTWLVSQKTYKFVWECITRTYGGTEEAELHIFASQGKAEADFQILGSPGKDEMRKRTYPYLEVLAEQVW